jgi:hypothetical protein
VTSGVSESSTTTRTLISGVFETSMMVPVPTGSLKTGAFVEERTSMLQDVERVSLPSLTLNVKACIPTSSVFGVQRNNAEEPSCPNVTPSRLGKSAMSDE